jgi:hypothetical protein
MHESPDLDSVAASFLAEACLKQGVFPESSGKLAAYVDGVAEGSIGMSPENRYSLYSAFMQLCHRAALRNWPCPRDQWTQWVVEGKQVIAHVLNTANQEGLAIGAIDAFKTPGVLGVMDRREIDADCERYHRKLSDSRCCARQARLWLPTLDGEMRAIEMLFVRDVQNADDPDRCILFKDWARSDRLRCPATNGFIGLCVSSADGPTGTFRCTISVRRDSGVSLLVLAQQLEAAEAARRSANAGVDDRQQDPKTGKSKEPRPGYASADPWYDGRSHSFSIIGSPISGTLLSPDEIYELVGSIGLRSDK